MPTMKHGRIPGRMHASSQELLEEAAGLLLAAKSVSDLDEVGEIISLVQQREKDSESNVLTFRRSPPP